MAEYYAGYRGLSTDPRDVHHSVSSGFRLHRGPILSYAAQQRLQCLEEGKMAARVRPDSWFRVVIKCFLLFVRVLLVC